MDCCVNNLANLILEKLMNATIEQSRYICCFKGIAEDFEEEKETLKARRSTVEGEVQRAIKTKGESIKHDVTLWCKEADALITEDTKTRVTCFFGRCPNCKWQYSRGKELANKTQKIKTLMQNKFESVGIPCGVAGVEYHSSQYYISFKSRELKYKELLDTLTDDKNYMTGLHGMGGAGKTTLATEVGKELKKSGKFVQVIDTTVSYTPDIKKIQDDIAGPLGLSLKECTESERLKRLWSRLTNGDKILIILDDVWGVIKFKEIGIPYKDDHNGCRILVTTRNLQVCNKMECDKIIQLELLSEKDAWMLFEKHAGLSNRSSKSILDLGGKIAKECKGLPVAIAVIASSLNGQQSQEEWKVALQSLRKSMPLHIHDENLGEIYKCLKYSYDHMKNETARRLFLLCSVFREDEEIHADILTKLSIGVGLVEKIGDEDDSYDARRNEVVVAKNKLIDSCLLLKKHNNFEKGNVKMHDLVREVALWIANEEIKAVNISDKNQKSFDEKVKNLKYLLCEVKVIDVFSFRFDGPKLEILIVYMDGDESDYVEVPNSFFENMAGLRVLYLSHKRWMTTTLSLTQSIESLTNIRYLHLERFILGDISILRNLCSLESLDLVYCSIDELPREIAELEKLKLLYVFRCKIRRNNPFKVIESCSSLEELYFFRNSLTDSSTMHQKAKLPKLQRFCIGTMYSHSWVDATVGNSLFVSNADDLFSEDTLKHLLQTTQFLHLWGLESEWRNLIPEMILPEDEGTLNLVELELKSISQLQCLVDTKDIDSRRVQNVFSNLTSLHLEDCPSLTSLFQMSTTQSLVLLESLTIQNCEQLRSIITNERAREDLGEEIVDGDIDDKSHGSVFPNLKTLRINSCPELNFILPVVAARDVPKLEDIEIYDCVELKYIFGPYQHKHEEQDLHQEFRDVIFVTLKEVFLFDLPNFVDIFPECDQCIGYVKRSCFKDGSKTQIEFADPIKCNIFPWTRKYRHELRNTKIPLDSKDQLQDFSLSSCEGKNVVAWGDPLKVNWLFIDKIVHDSKVNDVIGQEMIVWLQNIQLSDRPPQMTCLTLQHVIVLMIVKCETLKVIFSASMLRCLPQLHTLVIHECNELKQIIDDEDIRNHRMSFFPNLKLLVIEGCNNLKCVFPISTSKMLPRLEILMIKEASILEEVFRCESYQKVEISNLKIAVFVELPSLCQGIEFQIVKDRWVKNCPKLSLTSTSTREEFKEIIDSFFEEHFKSIGSYEVKVYMYKIFEDIGDLYEDSEAEETSNQNPTAKATEGFPIETKVEAASESDLTSSNENGIKSNGFIFVETQTKETLEAEQEFLEKVPSLEIPSKAISPTDSELIRRPCRSASENLLYKTHSLRLKEIEDKSTEEGSMSEKTLIATLSTHPKMTKISSGPLVTPLQKESKRSVEEGTTSAHDKIIASTSCSESVSSLLGPSVTSECKIDPQEDGEGQIAIPSFSVVNIEPATAKDVGDGDTLDIPLHETHSHFPKEIEDRSTEEGSMADKSLIATLTTFPQTSETSCEPLFTPPQKGIKRSFEEGTTSAVSKTIALSTGSESGHGEGQIVIVPSFSVVNTELAIATTKDVGVGDIQETSKSMVTHFDSNAPENLSQITEDSSFAYIVTRELDRLVSNKHLASENLSLLTNFLMKHPSVRLTDNAVSDRYKGFAYTCLAELLKFLQTHSVLDVLGSSHSEFVELLEDVRRFGFNRDWLNDVERRALFRRLQMSEDALQKLLDSKHALIQHLEDLKHQLEEQEAQVLEVRATLSTPLGF